MVFSIFIDFFTTICGNNFPSHSFNPPFGLLVSHSTLFSVLIASTGDGDLPDTDHAVGVSGKQGLSISGPGEGDAERGLGVGGQLGSQLINDNLTLQILYNTNQNNYKSWFETLVTVILTSYKP